MVVVVRDCVADGVSVVVVVLCDCVADGFCVVVLVVVCCAMADTDSARAKIVPARTVPNFFVIIPSPLAPAMLSRPALEFARQ